VVQRLKDARKNPEQLRKTLEAMQLAYGGLDKQLVAAKNRSLSKEQRTAALSGLYQSVQKDGKPETRQ